jgi:hypothetical protein
MDRSAGNLRRLYMARADGLQRIDLLPVFTRFHERKLDQFAIT